MTRKTASFFTKANWKQILSCAEETERRLENGKLELTLGGEPTFIPLNPRGAEWNTEAHGPEKLDYARRLASRLILDAHPGGVFLHTSGKHYPGEPLPRWNVQVQYHKTGETLWRNPSLLAQRDRKGPHTETAAHKIIRTLARTLNLEKFVLTAFERSPDGRAAGWVLPLDRIDTKWRSSAWPTAGKPRGVHALPGTSLLGFRLPLSELPGECLARALTTEIREGNPTIFIPPLPDDAYIELIRKIEETVEALDLDHVVLAGYAPSGGNQIEAIGLASDPGVLEVNMTVCRTWHEYREQIDRLYTSANRIGLCGRKLHFNGLKTGTGGGAHLCFGGPSPETSPFLLEPRLLTSIIRYWQHHPSLSYLFTGQYLGPSSQAPRVDESAFDTLYELEIACNGAERAKGTLDGPFLDQLFGDLLMDRSGNTHRAEISMDKFWNQHAPNGRIGLLEFRAFESHESSDVLSVVALFVRCILARLAEKPFRKPFKYWKGLLHDRYFLPTFLWEDLKGVVDELNSHGLPFKSEWLTTVWEFRFPLIGRLRIPGVGNITFRHALEAWPLLGERPAGGVTSRSVDSSTERIEALIDDPNVLEKGKLLINGHPAKFQRQESFAVAGIRYRAFFFTPCLQPHVHCHAPLRIEWIDRKEQAVRAAAEWHSWNPGGGTYKDRPQNDIEASKRRRARWRLRPDSLGSRRTVAAASFSPEAKYTLDLRRQF